MPKIIAAVEVARVAVAAHRTVPADVEGNPRGDHARIMMTASTLCVDSVDEASCRPDFTILVYPAYLMNEANDGLDDLIVAESWSQLTFATTPPGLQRPLDRTETGEETAEQRNGGTDPAGRARPGNPRDPG